MINRYKECCIGLAEHCMDFQTRHYSCKTIVSEKMYDLSFWFIYSLRDKLPYKKLMVKLLMKMIKKNQRSIIITERKQICWYVI